MSSVYDGPRTRPSATRLSLELDKLGYEGPNINFGYGISDYALNKPEAIRLASNKRLALRAMAEAGVPVPEQWRAQEAISLAEGNHAFPLVGRPDSHRQGSGFWLCHNYEDLRKAITGTRTKAAATHFMEYINIEREFRVHVVNGKSIKISEKIGGGNHSRGAKFSYPHDFNHKKTLRRVSRAAVAALGLDFGAVDVIYSGEKFYVTEVNSAPALTDATSDTLERYALAFIRGEYDGDHDYLSVCEDTSVSLVAATPVRCGCDCHDTN